MSKFPCLNRRPSGIYAIRLIVPARLRPIIGKREIHISTHLRDREAAKTAAMQILLNWREKFTQMDLNRLHSGSPLLSNHLISISEAAPAIGLSINTLLIEILNRKIPIYLFISASLGLVVDQNDYIEREPDGRLILNSIRELGQEAVHSGFVRPINTWETLTNWITGRNSSEFQLIMEGGNYFFPSAENQRSFSVADGLVQGKDIETIRRAYAEATECLPVQTQHITSAQQTSQLGYMPSKIEALHGNKRFSTLVEVFLDGHKNSTEKCRKVKSECDTFIDLIGDVTLCELTSDLIKQYAELLSKLPEYNLAKTRKYCNKSPREAIELAEKDNDPRLSESTIRTRLDHLNAVFKEGNTKLLLDTNPVTAHKGSARQPNTKSKRNIRHIFTDAELHLIFNNEHADWFKTGHLFAEKWFRAGELVTGHNKQQPTTRNLPYFYWFPILSLLSGARPNELAQLHLDDILQTENGVWYLDFNLNDGKTDYDKTEASSPQQFTNALDKSLKNPNAHRVTPIHSKLLELGFIDYVTALRNAGYKRLFEELRFDENRGYAKDVGDWFNERYIGTLLKIPRDNGKVLYSFRHNFITALGNLDGLEERVIGQLVGHERGDTETTKTYLKDRGAELLQPVIERLNYPCVQSITPFNVQLGIKALEIKLAR